MEELNKQPLFSPQNYPLNMKNEQRQQLESFSKQTSECESLKGVYLYIFIYFEL